MYGSGETWGILYRSYASIGENSPRQLQVLSGYSALVNQCSITGYLHREDDVLLQYFEGPCASVHMILDMIRAHDSHHGVTVLARQVVPRRVFGEWSYGTSKLNGISHFQWASAINRPLRRNEPNDLLDFLCSSHAGRSDPARLCS